MRICKSGTWDWNWNVNLSSTTNWDGHLVQYKCMFIIYYPNFFPRIHPRFLPHFTPLRAAPHEPPIQFLFFLKYFWAPNLYCSGPSLSVYTYRMVVPVVSLQNFVLPNNTCRLRESLRFEKKLDSDERCGSNILRFQVFVNCYCCLLLSARTRTVGVTTLTN